MRRLQSVAYHRHLLKRLSHGRDLNVLMIKSHCRRNGGLARSLRFNAKLLQRLPETFGWRRAIRTRSSRFSKAKTLAETMPRQRVMLASESFYISYVPFCAETRQIPSRKRIVEHCASRKQQLVGCCREGYSVCSI